MVRRVGAPRALMTVAVLALGALAVGCGDSGGEDAGGDAAATSTTTEQRPLRIVVTNDDGIGSPGLDQLVQGLSALPDVEIVGPHHRG
jgi:5'-nucleotidase